VCASVSGATSWTELLLPALICPSTEVADEIDQSCLYMSLTFSGLLPVLALLTLGSLCNIYAMYRFCALLTLYSGYT
jgi:hypothetical protein